MYYLECTCINFLDCVSNLYTKHVHIMIIDQHLMYYTIYKSVQRVFEAKNV